LANFEDAKIPNRKSQMTNNKNPNSKPAQNPQSVFVLNFENWDLQIAWNL